MIIRSLPFSHRQNASNLSELTLDQITNVAHHQAWLVASVPEEIQTAASILQSKNIRFSQRRSDAHGSTLVLGWECNQAAVISWRIVATAKLFLNPKNIPYLLSAGFTLFWANDKWKEQTQMGFFCRSPPDSLAVSVLVRHLLLADRNRTTDSRNNCLSLWESVKLRPIYCNLVYFITLSIL